MPLAGRLTAQPPRRILHRGQGGHAPVPVSVNVPEAGPAMLKVVPRRTTRASVSRYWSPAWIIDRYFGSVVLKYCFVLKLLL